MERSKGITSPACPSLITASSL